MLIPLDIKRFIARLLVGVLVFAQVTVAAYACEGGLGVSSASVAASGTDMPMLRVSMTGGADGDFGHASMDPMQPNLCAAHCQSSQQNADDKPAPSVPAVIPVSLYPRALAVRSADIQHASVAPDDSLPKAGPAHAILHCCFRI